MTQTATATDHLGRRRHPLLVVTYREAYRQGVVWCLCAQHAADTIEARTARSAAGIGALGSVSHGAHRGACDILHA